MAGSGGKWTDDVYDLTGSVSFVHTNTSGPLPFTCVDIDVYTASRTYFQKHVLITIGVLRQRCGWSAHDVDRRMDAEDLVSEAYLKLRKVCITTNVDDLYRYLSTTLRHDVIHFCMHAKRKVELVDEHVVHGQRPDDRPTDPEIEAVFDRARSKITDQRDRALFEMYIQGAPNRAMRAVDPRSDRQITRLRTRFSELLRTCREQINV